LVSEAPRSAPREPYRVLFPLGVVYALIGAGAWPVAALAPIAYPGPLHVTLMVQGFEQCFVLGFLLTAMPAFTHGPKCHPLELAGALAAMLGFGAAALAGATAAAHGAFLASLVLIAIAGARRVLGNPQRPPEEFLFVGFGLALGTLGGALLLAIALGAAPDLPARFPERLVSLGMVLSLVVGVGSLLVPAFAGIKDPLLIPGIARPHERRGRRALYLTVIAVLALAFVAEARGFARAGAAARALAVTTMGLWVWKLTRLPRRDAPGFALWSSGWIAIAGTWALALFASRPMIGLHVVFIGGFGLLTMGIATRVVVSHGRIPLAHERRTLNGAVLAPFALAIALRLAAELVPRGAPHALAASGLCWMVAWSWWVFATTFARPR
jgi:uncharacterized protein involved in response to NO